MSRCRTMVNYRRFEGLRQILIPNIRFVETTLGQNSYMMLEMEVLLSKLKRYERNFEEAADSAFRGIILVNRQSLVTR